MEVIDLNECNGNNNFYVVKDGDRKYVVMHIVKGKFAIYDFQFHDVILNLCPWYANNGSACMILRQHHKDMFPHMSFEVNKLLYMHLLIKSFCLQDPTGNEKHVLHHINQRKRDNRIENLIWVSKNQQRALIKNVGKLNKPPVELRNVMPLLPKFCRWINAKKSFWIDSHPACFLAVENKEQKHKYIESKKGKKHTVQAKFDDFVSKYEEMMAKPFGGQVSFYKYEEFKQYLEDTNKAICMLASNKAIEGIEDENANDEMAKLEITSDHDSVELD